MHKTDIVIIGAGAAGLMCAIAAGRRGLKVTVLDHANKPGKKILMSGGGRCNFTNLEITPEHYQSQNPHFCRSALSRFTQWDFISWVERYRIPYYEKKNGQLFCKRSSQDILDMLLRECSDAGVIIRLNTPVINIKPYLEEGFQLTTSRGEWRCQALVAATGGLSIPKMGATPFGYRIAEDFGHTIIPPRAGLVPLIWKPHDKNRYAGLAGISLNALVTCGDHQFHDDILFTHKGLSGPAILQISSYWLPSSPVTIDFLPAQSFEEIIQLARQSHPHRQLKSQLAHYLPKRLIPMLIRQEISESPIANISNEQIHMICQAIHHWKFVPEGTEGYKSAEVTIGGVNCHELSSKTFESRLTPNLHFIGEVVDVTGQLGGYNFQWAWSSGWCAGEMICEAP